MIILKKSMPRRTFLRGAGAALALPFLDAMIPAFAASSGAANPPLKLGFIYLPVGRIMENWTPKIEGSGKNGNHRIQKRQRQSRPGASQESSARHGFLKNDHRCWPSYTGTAYFQSLRL